MKYLYNIVYVRWCNLAVNRVRNRNGSTPRSAPCSSRSRTRDCPQEKQRQIESVPRRLTRLDVRFQLSSRYLGPPFLSRRKTASPWDWSCHSKTIKLLVNLQSILIFFYQITTFDNRKLLVLIFLQKLYNFIKSSILQTINSKSRK